MYTVSTNNPVILFSFLQKYKQPAPTNVFSMVYVYKFLTKWNMLVCG